MRVVAGRIRDGRVVSRGRGSPVLVRAGGLRGGGLTPTADVRAERRGGHSAAPAAREERQSEDDVRELT